MADERIKKMLVLGAGSAGLLAAITVKRKLPGIEVTVVRSTDIGVIGVGEGTTPAFPAHLFGYLGIHPKHFYAAAEPTWKIGIRFEWGPRKHFDFSLQQQLELKWADLSHSHGYYCEEEMECVNVGSALMSAGRVAVRQPVGNGPRLEGWHAFHIENKKLVSCLETLAKDAGVIFIDGKVEGAVPGPAGISAVKLEDGQTLEADFFIDASGFRSELLGRALQEPYISFDKSLFCDRAVIGGWERTDEPILPYTRAETMDAGWCWQIEHEKYINRGYVYASRFSSDEAATEEFLRKNPKAPKAPRVVKFRSGRYQRAVVGNVLSMGNSGGFVEPLEATALNLVTTQCQMMVQMLFVDQLPPTESMRELYNAISGAMWDEIRDFLGMHYRFNTRLETPFWQCCRAEADVSGVAAFLKCYEENGPTGLCSHYMRNTMRAGTQFGLDGFLTILVGNRVPYQRKYAAPAAEREIWRKHCNDNRELVKNGLDVKEALQFVRHPNWRWHAEG